MIISQAMLGRDKRVGAIPILPRLLAGLFYASIQTDADDNLLMFIVSTIWDFELMDKGRGNFWV